MTSVFCLTRCILYPGTKIVIASGNRGQAAQVLEKIDKEIFTDAPLARQELKYYKNSLNQVEMVFKNGSYIKVVTANDGARSARANILLLDEFRIISKHVIDTVLTKFLTATRTPRFMKLPEYKDYPQEENKEIYLSSAWYKTHWSWTKCAGYVHDMANQKTNTTIMTIPYQVAISEGLYSKKRAIAEMNASDFNADAWAIEMCCEWFGEGSKSLFKLENMLATQKIYTPVYPKYLCNRYASKKLQYVKKQNGEIRLLSVDIALSGGNANDNTSMTLIQLIPNANNQYIRKYTYATVDNGGRTEYIALKIRRLYAELDCDYIVLDLRNVGLSIFDSLSAEIRDDMLGVVYPALNCMNNESVAARCVDPYAPKVIYGVTASSRFNSDCAIGFRDAINRNKIQTLVSEKEGREIISKYEFYHSLSEEDLKELLEPYANFHAMILETVKLEYETRADNTVTVREVSGMRKDRYTSASYGNYYASELEQNLRQAPASTSMAEFARRLRKINRKPAEA